MQLVSWKGDPSGDSATLGFQVSRGNNYLLRTNVTCLGFIKNCMYFWKVTIHSFMWELLTITIKELTQGSYTEGMPSDEVYCTLDKKCHPVTFPGAWGSIRGREHSISSDLELELATSQSQPVCLWDELDFLVPSTSFMVINQMWKSTGCYILSHLIYLTTFAKYLLGSLIHTRPWTLPERNKQKCGSGWGKIP